jgi:FemAB-related protein (PEP-CTERM system-associated)
MEVRELGSRSVEWDAFVRERPDGSPFHLVAWRRAVERAYGHRPHYLMATRGNGVEGVLPLFEVRGLFGGKGLVSSPYAVYGGICASSDAAREALCAAGGALARRVGAAYVELRHRPGQELDLPTKALYVTFARPLSASEAENLEAIPRKQRRMTRQGEKHGLRHELGLIHLDAFYDVYAHSVHQLGSPVFSRRLFRAIAEEFGKDCELLTVWKDDWLCAGVLTLYHEDQVLPYYGGAHRDAFPAASAGFRVFDFGRSREGTGAYHFKRHWGFVPQPLPYQYVLRDGGAMPNLSPANRKMRGAVEVWKRMPFALSKLLGPPLTKYLP